MYTFVLVTTVFAFYLDTFCVLLVTIATFSFLLMNNCKNRFSSVECPPRICYFLTSRKNYCLSAFTDGEIGLAITQILAITGIMQFAMRQNAEMTNQLMAVERVIDYIQLPPESNLRDRGIFLRKKSTHKWDIALPANTPKNWPSKGSIEFKNVYMRYADEIPPVLKELEIMIPAGEKVCEFQVRILCSM